MKSALGLFSVVLLSSAVAQAGSMDLEGRNLEFNLNTVGDTSCVAVTSKMVEANSDTLSMSFGDCKRIVSGFRSFQRATVKFSVAEGIINSGTFNLSTIEFNMTDSTSMNGLKGQCETVARYLGKLTVNQSVRGQKGYNLFLKGECRERTDFTGYDMLVTGIAHNI